MVFHEKLIQWYVSATLTRSGGLCGVKPVQVVRSLKYLFYCNGHFSVCQRSGKEWKSDKGGTSGGGALSADSGWSQMAAAHRAAAKQGATGPEVLQIAQQMAELLDGEEDASE